MAYLYRHIRLDKNQPFYIGIGGDLDYKRAYSKQRRNKIWNKIIERTDFEVEIIMDNLTWNFVCEKEKEFISLYGRLDKKTGILCNMTDGGEGAFGRVYKPTKETIEKMKVSRRKRSPVTEETRKKMSNSRKGIVFSEEHRRRLSEAAEKRMELRI